jgi:hypothetical protein
MLVVTEFSAPRLASEADTEASVADPKGEALAKYLTEHP